METWCESCEEVRMYPHDCPYECKTRKAVKPKRKIMDYLDSLPWYAWLLIIGLGGIGSHLIAGYVLGLFKH